MALKVLMLRKKLETAKAKLAALREARKSIETRSAELEGDIAEAKTEEEQAVVETAVNELEAEDAANAAAIAEAEAEIQQLESEIADTEAKAAEARSANPAPRENENNFERRDTPMNETIAPAALRRNHFGMNRRQRVEFANRPENKEFVARARTFLTERRSVTGAELAIPTETLEIMRDNMHRYSKLIGYVTLKKLKGKARQNVLGTVPEAVWTEAVGALNELNFSLSQIEADGFKVGGFVAIPNSYIEDSDVNLLFEIMDMSSQSIGLGIDKAIVYGTGTKMPVGIVTRLAATSQPTWWGTNQGTFTDLHTSNIHKLNIGSQSGTSFFIPLLEKLGLASSRYSMGTKVWLMNESTHTTISIKALAFNAAAALVAGVTGTMPVLGGDIIELPFIPAGDIIGGYIDLYRLYERSGTVLKSSEHAKFIQDELVCLAEARYDGKPARGEAFVAVNFNNTDVTTAPSFASDTANTVVTTDDDDDDDDTAGGGSNTEGGGGSGGTVG